MHTVVRRKVSARILRNRWTIPHTAFYKKYPFCSKASIQSADARGCVDLEMGFFCNRIPKAANSTVVSSLATLKLGRKTGSKEAKRLFSNPSELSQSQLSRFETLYKFVFVRNPFSRTLSAYLDKVHRKRQGASGLEVVGQVDQMQARDGFRDFLKSLQQGKLFNNAHWAPQTSILLIPVERFDFVGKVESLDQDLSQVLDRLSRQTSLDHGFQDQSPQPGAGYQQRTGVEPVLTPIPTSTPVPTSALTPKSDAAPAGAKINPVFSNATGAVSKLAFYYDDETVEIVRKLYRNDFELFRYSTEFE